MLSSPELISRARQEAAPSGLGSRISRTRVRRKATRRLAITSAGILAISIPMLLSPRPAYAADPLAAIAGTLDQPIMRLKSWRDVRGQIMPATEEIYRGTTSLIRRGSWTQIDDGKLVQEYCADADKLFVDESTRKGPMPKPRLLQDIQSKRWKWGQVKGKHSHNGEEALLYKADGTYRDGGRDHSIVVKVFVDPKNQRVMFLEQRVDDSWSDFFEYTYPATANFSLGNKSTTTKIDVVAERNRLRKAASSSSPGLVGVAVDMWGSVILVTRGGSAPDPKKPQTITVDGTKLQGTTYAYGIQRPTLGKIGKDVYYQTANMSLRSPDELKRWQMRDFTKPIEITYSFNGTVKTQKVKVLQTSSAVHFILPLISAEQIRR